MRAFRVLRGGFRAKKRVGTAFLASAAAVGLGMLGYSFYSDNQKANFSFADDPRVQIEQVKNKNNLDVLRLTVKGKDQQKSTVEIFLYGAHITKWEETGQAPFLFLSDKAILDGTAAIRGGIPLCFPQFGPGPLKNHGFVRNITWNICHTTADEKNETAEVVLKLSDGNETSSWKNKFQTKLQVKLVGSKNSTLECNWIVKNANSPQDENGGAFSFTNALHTYFGVSDISNVTVSNLSGLSYHDQVQKGKVVPSDVSDLKINGEVDRTYINAPDNLTITDTGNNRTLHVAKRNFPDAVVWNPWVEKAKAMKDFQADEYKKMVCVEAGAIATPVKLSPTEQWIGNLKLSWAPLKNKA